MYVTCSVPWKKKEEETSVVTCIFRKFRTSLRLVFRSAMADWMSRLPPAARDKPLMYMAIPGLSHLHDQASQVILFQKHNNVFGHALPFSISILLYEKMIEIDKKRVNFEKKIIVLLYEILMRHDLMPTL